MCRANLGPNARDRGVIPLAQSVQDLVNKAQRRTLATNDPDYQRLVRQAEQGDQTAKNALERIDAAGGANSRVSVNKLI
jgi:hypothetical protein